MPSAFDFPRDAAGNRIRVVGNAGRNTFQQPGLNNWDMGMFKNFRVTERINAQFRWETFNTWNHTQFGSANTNTTEPDIRRHHQHACHRSPDAVGTETDLLEGSTS